MVGLCCCLKNNIINSFPLDKSKLIVFAMDEDARDQEGAIGLEDKHAADHKTSQTYTMALDS